MNFLQTISDINDFADIIDYIDLLLYSRPIPYREYDQIYMKARYMLAQVGYVQDYLANQKVVFLGDGDGMSVLLSLLSPKYNLSIRSMSVFDFDERILKVFHKIQNDLQIAVPTTFHLYNIIDPVDCSEFGKYDFFYINPPYGSKNDGLSCVLWLYRCMDLITDKGRGCIIIPDDENEPWTKKCSSNIEKFLHRYGFNIIQREKNIHMYHLDDNPRLHSSMIIVERINSQISPYRAKQFSASMCKNIYGTTRPIPHYIYCDDTPRGVCDFNWKYGTLGAFASDILE